jgi:hypothetical protein
MANDVPDRAKHFRALATDALIAATETTDPQAKSVLIDISVIYEKLALRIELPSSPTVARVVLIKKP